MRRATILGVVLVALVPAAWGEIVISEWMYNGTGLENLGEFVEFTNTGPDAIDMTGWSFDDSSRTAGTISLSEFGVVQPGQSVILTDETAADFAANWGLVGVGIVGGNTANLGRNDEINLFDAAGELVDRLTYGDEDFAGTVRTNARSCNIPSMGYGYAEVQTGWLLATEGDAFGSLASARGEVGSPGQVVGYALSDFDQDGDVDLGDFELLDCCTTGPFASYDPLPSECGLTPDAEGFLIVDCDRDGDVDLADFTTVQRCFSGEGNPADPTCGRGWQAPAATHITLNGDSITVDGAGVTVEATTATIVAQGTYTVSGVLNDGQLIVNSTDGGVVELILNGVNITSSTSAPVAIMSAGYAVIVLADGTQNTLTDAETYIYEDPDQDEPNASLFSKDSLMISGTGTLTVYGNYNDAIASKDELVIAGGTINAIAVDDGIRGKDYLQIDDGTIIVDAGGDGLKSDEDEDPERGYIAIAGGVLDIASGGDAIAAETTVSITGGEFTILSGGGAGATIPEDLSAKGIKGLVSVVIDGGTLDIDAADDGVHSNDTIIVNDGTIMMATADDGLHADVALEINGGSVTVTECYEGIESTDIAITAGEIDVTSDEDAITAEVTVSIAGGEFTISSGGGHTASIPSGFSAKGIKGLVSVVIEDGTFDIDSADDGIHSNDTIVIGGGTITIATGDDGVHADEVIEINGGTITVTNSYEGIEASDITINAGNVHVNSSDDGINGAGGVDGSGGWPPPPPGDHWLYIHGGVIVVYAQGDGIDVNGSIVMTGGTVVVHGPTGDFNGALDYDQSFNISGGFLVAAGSAGMAQAPSSSSTQRSVKITYSSWKTGGTLAHIQRAVGSIDVLTFAPAKNYRSLVVSTPAFQSGVSFELYRAGSCTGAVMDGLYQGGVYTPGTKTTTFTTNNIVTNVSAP